MPASLSLTSSRLLERLLWLLAGLLVLPGLFTGPVFDDWIQAYIAHEHAPSVRSVFGLYEFFRQDQVHLARGYGLLPWWADDGLSIAFFRPLSSLLLSVDHLWLDQGGFWSHLQSAIWFVLTIVAAWRVLRLLFAAAEARWATLIYALLGCHVLPLAFTAALHSHVTAVFALASFECVIRGVESGRRRFRTLSGLLFLFALFSGESAVAILPLALGYLTVELGARRALLRLAPELVSMLGFAALYAAFDYGSHHSAAYLQPGSAGFFLGLPSRWLVLVAGLFSGFPPDLWLFGAEPLQIGIGILALVLAGLALRSVARGLDQKSARRLTALLIGALVALVPLTAGIPCGRILILPSLASAALFGIAARRVASDGSVRARGRVVLLGAWVALLGIGLNPVFRMAVPRDMARVGRELPEAARGIAERCRGATAVGVGVPDPNAAYLAQLFVAQAAGRAPQLLHLISMAPGEHRLSELEPGHFELEIAGDFLALPWSRIYRDTPIVAALTRQVQGLDLEVLEASSSRTRLGLRVHEGVQACWLTLRGGQYVELQPSLDAPLVWTPSLTKS